MSARLIVSADDFGLTDGVCRAVLHGHRHGLVTATSLLAVGRSFDLAARMLADHPGLDVGRAPGDRRRGSAAADRPGDSDAGRPARRLSAVVPDRGGPRRRPAGSTRTTCGGSSPPSWTGSPGPVSRCPIWTPTSTPTCGRRWPRVLVELALEREVPGVRTPRSARLLPVGAPVNLLSARLRHRIERAGLVTTTAYAGLDEAGAIGRGCLPARGVRARRGPARDGSARSRSTRTRVRPETLTWTDLTGADITGPTSWPC